MEKNSVEIITEETEKETAEETTITVEEAVEKILKPLPYNRNERYAPTEYELRDYRSSWKKCHCGRQTWFNDNFCPACG